MSVILSLAVVLTVPLTAYAVDNANVGRSKRLSQDIGSDIGGDIDRGSR